MPNIKHTPVRDLDKQKLLQLDRKPVMNIKELSEAVKRILIYIKIK